MAKINDEWRKKLRVQASELANEIETCLQLSDEERTIRYGTEGWKLLVKQYIQNNRDRLSHE